MFDMGFTEMMLIGIVALIVIGPERLPGVARTAGKYFGRLKRFMTTVRADVEQELRADELRQILADQQRELDTLKDSISEAGKDMEAAGRELGEQAGALGKAGGDLAAGVDEASSAEDATTDGEAVEEPVAANAGDADNVAAAEDKPAAKAGS